MGELKLNERAMAIADELAIRADELGVEVSRIAGARIIDAGSKQVGSLQAGLLVARVCLSDLASVQLVPGRIKDLSTPAVQVSVHRPVPACMASQYAGWQINVNGYFAMGSGPMRAAYGKEKLFDDIGHREKPEVAVGVLETNKLPTQEVVEFICQKSGVGPENLTLVIARTASLAGGVQIVARSVETALHKLHELGFDLHRIVGGYGVAPVPPVARGDITAIGRTNDAVLYGGEVSLFVKGDDESLADIVAKLPSSASKDYGQPFGKVFKHYNHDFYKIDPMLFSPASVVLQNIESGKSHRAGSVNQDVLYGSFFE